MCFDLDNVASDSQAIALDTFHQGTSESTRVSFDAEGNRITERIYRQQDRPDVIRTTIENAADILNTTLNLGPQSTYQHLRIPKVIVDQKTEHRNASMLDPIILPSDGIEGIGMTYNVRIEDQKVETGNSTVIDQLIQPAEGSETNDLVTVIPTEDQKSILSNSSVRDPLIQPSDRSKKIDLVSDVEYLGVLLDAGRHYFPVEWIYHLLDHLELLGFNLLHFRLTDDQAFNMRLDSHPELAQPANGSGGKVYTPTELRQLVEHAKSKGIVIMPEINVPGHAGGFAGAIPRLVVPCARFICEKGYGLPLNVSHPQLLPILKDIMIEVKDIFNNTPFFHLGGDELHMAKDCFDELGVEFLDYDRFETDLGIMLLEIGIAREQVVRWEKTAEISEHAIDARAKGIDHFWSTRRYQDLNITVAPRVFCSEGLYFDTNQDDEAWTIYNKAKSMRLHERKPIAIIAGTFELGVDYWVIRNVLGRLLAVAIGSSNENYEDEQEFADRYETLCKSLDLPEEICVKLGAPMVAYDDFRADWEITSGDWRRNLCDRLAVKDVVPTLVFSPRSIEINQRAANTQFWDHFARLEPIFPAFTNTNATQTRVSQGHQLQRIKQHAIKHTGIVLDLVEGGSYSADKLARILAIVDYLGELGFTLVQLRVMNDYGFAIQIEEYSSMVFGHSDGSYKPWPMEAVAKIIQRAATWGILIVPELTVAHRAGGWYRAAPMVQCPRHHSEEGKGLTVNTSSGSLLPVLLSILLELRQTFSSPYIHLGYDEREESMACAKEALAEVDFEVFELKMWKLLQHFDFTPANILRWENEEGVHYEHRFGLVTHYRTRLPPQGTNASASFISTDLDLHDALSKYETAWDLYQHVQKLVALQPLGVLASVVTSRDSILKKLNMRQRLLAVSIGLSVKDLDESAFRVVFSDLCKAAKNTGCERFGTIENRNALAVLMDSEQKQMHEETTKDRLGSITVARPREGILVENGTNTYAMQRTMYESFAGQFDMIST